LLKKLHPTFLKPECRKLADIYLKAFRNEAKRFELSCPNSEILMKEGINFTRSSGYRA